MPNHHLVTVWNPTYATDALHAHISVLLDWERAAGADVAQRYVWWGKVKSEQRQQKMPHLHEILELSPGEDDVHEVHLYLTDYRSLYVALVDCITTHDPRVDDGAHVPAYYAEQDLQCDCWFELSDVRLLVHDNLEGVAAELKALRNVRYGDRPVSMYGGMVDLPLIVSRPTPRSYFSKTEGALFTGGESWASFDRAQDGIGAIEATLRLDHFGAAKWQRLEGPARRFITTAETVLRRDRGDLSADLTPVAVSYGKAIEAQLAAVLHLALHDAPESLQCMNVDGISRRVPDMLPMTLAQAALALNDDQQRALYLRDRLRGGGWLVDEFSHFVADFARTARNPSSHGGPEPRRAAILEARDRLLGVGCHGLLAQLACVARK